MTLVSQSQWSPWVSVGWMLGKVSLRLSGTYCLIWCHPVLGESVLCIPYLYFPDARRPPPIAATDSMASP